MRGAGTKTPGAGRCSGSVARVSKKRNFPEEKSRARFSPGARCCACARACGLGLVLGLGSVLVWVLCLRHPAPRVVPGGHPAGVVRGFCFSRFQPPAAVGVVGARHTKQTPVFVGNAFVLVFAWCASTVRKFRLYGTIAPRSAFVCHSDALHLPAGVVARSLRFRLVLGLVLVWVLSLKSRVFSSHRARFPAYFRHILRGYPRPRRYSFCVLVQNFPRFRLGLGIIDGFFGCVFHMAQVS